MVDIAFSNSSTEAMLKIRRWTRWRRWRNIDWSRWCFFNCDTECESWRLHLAYRSSEVMVARKIQVNLVESVDLETSWWAVSQYSLEDEAELKMSGCGWLVVGWWWWELRRFQFPARRPLNYPAERGNHILAPPSSHPPTTSSSSTHISGLLLHHYANFRLEHFLHIFFETCFFLFTWQKTDEWVEVKDQTQTEDLHVLSMWVSVSWCYSGSLVVVLPTLPYLDR